jgi:hypothetical protein
MADAYKWLKCVQNELPDETAHLSLSEVLKNYKPNPSYFSQTHIEEDWAITPQLVKDFLKAFKQDPAVFCGYTASQLTNICYAEQLASRLIDIGNELTINKNNFDTLLNERTNEPLPRRITQWLNPDYDRPILFETNPQTGFIIHVNGSKDNLPAIFNPISKNDTDTRASICYNNLPNPYPTPQQQEPSANLNNENLSLDYIFSVLTGYTNTNRLYIDYNLYDDNNRPGPDEILVQVKTQNTGSTFDYTPVARIYRDNTGKIQFESLLCLNVDINYWVTKIENILSVSGLYITRNDVGSGFRSGQITNKPSPPPSPSAP